MEGESPTLKTFNNYTIIMNNSNDIIRIFQVWCFFSLLLIFQLIQQAALVSFMLFLNILKILKISFWIFWKKDYISLDLWALFSCKPCKAFRKAQCKQPRLVNLSLNFDLHFISKTFTRYNRFLQTPLETLPGEQKIPSARTYRHINN